MYFLFGLSSQPLITIIKRADESCDGVAPCRLGGGVVVHVDADHHGVLQRTVAGPLKIKYLHFEKKKINVEITDMWLQYSNHPNTGHPNTGFI